jgi:dTDP-4-amino-4,6-dideoxygalactose transaminase
MDAIMEIARKHGLKVVEDARRRTAEDGADNAVGSIGDAATFSFYPGRTWARLAMRGAVVSQDEGLIERIRHAGESWSSREVHAQDGRLLTAGSTGCRRRSCA